MPRRRHAEQDEGALPGVRRERARRFVPRLHYELLVCGIAGHELVGLGARVLRDEDGLVAFVRDGVRWHRCLRCDSWLPVGAPVTPTEEHLPARDAIELPLRGKPLRDKVVLRLIAVNRAVHFLVLALLGVAILAFSANRGTLHARVYRVVTDLGGGVSSRGGGHGLLAEVDKAFTLDSSKLHLFAVIALAYAAVEGIEAVGLWRARRWAEYLTFLVTSSLLPLEVYELTHRLTPLKVLTFAINLAVVAYLLLAKRLFGLRGGAAADRAERDADVGWGALEAAGPNPSPRSA